jgi:molybdenum cofactor synthesis domain-containing protein
MSREPIGLPAEVVVASNRAAAGVYDDTTGPLIVEALTELGFEVAAPVVVPDGGPVGEAIRSAVDRGARLVLTTGGTGLTPTDRTPEVTLALLDFQIPGIPEALRAYGLSRNVHTAVLSRGVAGVVGTCLVVNLPGSRGGVKDAMAVLQHVLVHAVEQAVGSDH